MRKIDQCKVVRLLWPCLPQWRLLAVMLASVMLSACGGTHAEYDPKSPWIGKRVTFTPQMAYVTNLPRGFSDKEVLRIGRRLTLIAGAKDDKRFIRMMGEVIITPVPAGTTFNIIAAFTVVADGYTRIFAPDYDILVLQDNFGNVSTMLLDELQDITSEQIAQPLGG